ncbi:MAG: hypothetical protein K0R54_1423 [Clostridiaceae bacterium]|jgi:hypothetical protein|nr:hypothetical protein [Clostridiaceae bacterium]
MKIFNWEVITINIFRKFLILILIYFFCITCISNSITNVYGNNNIEGKIYSGDLKLINCNETAKVDDTLLFVKNIIIDKDSFYINYKTLNPSLIKSFNFKSIMVLNSEGLEYEHMESYSSKASITENFCQKYYGKITDLKEIYLKYNLYNREFYFKIPLKEEDKSVEKEFKGYNRLGDYY